MTPTITRAHLREAIEHGIAEMHIPISPEGQAALRKVGETATEVTIGDFWDADNACGCPLTQAGIFDPVADEDSDSITEFGERIGYRVGFWGDFDDKAHDFVNTTPGSVYYKVIN